MLLILLLILLLLLLPGEDVLVVVVVVLERGVPLGTMILMLQVVQKKSNKIKR